MPLEFDLEEDDLSLPLLWLPVLVDFLEEDRLFEVDELDELE